MDYNKYWEKIFEKNKEINALFNSYWNDYSNLETWQFWLIAFLFLSPLILLYFTVDRKRIFEVFFFGYTVHMLWTYGEIILARQGYFIHTYFLAPFIPNALSMTASVLPVAYLLLYQYCTRKKKNFYLYSLLLSAIFAFGLATVEEQLGLLKFEKGMNQFYLLLVDMIVAISALWLTKIVKKLGCRKM